MKMNSPAEVESFLKENTNLVSSVVSRAKYIFKLFIVPKKVWPLLSEEDIANLSLRPIDIRPKMISGVFFINLMSEQETLQLVMYLHRVPNGGKRIKIYVTCKDQFYIHDFEFSSWIEDYMSYNNLPVNEQKLMFIKLFGVTTTELKSNKIKETNGIYYG